MLAFIPTEYIIKILLLAMFSDTDYSEIVMFIPKHFASMSLYISNMNSRAYFIFNL